MVLGGALFGYFFQQHWRRLSDIWFIGEGFHTEVMGIRLRLAEMNPSHYNWFFVEVK